MPNSLDRVREFSCRAYGRVLFLYPARLRTEYGPDMQALFAAQVRDACADSGWAGLVGAWWCVAVEVVEGVVPVEIDWLRVGIPVASLASSLLALMFFVWASGAARHCVK
jgi:hypothetical protein